MKGSTSGPYLCRLSLVEDWLTQLIQENYHQMEILLDSDALWLQKVTVCLMECRPNYGF